MYVPYITFSNFKMQIKKYKGCSLGPKIMILNLIYLTNLKIRISKIDIEKILSRARTENRKESKSITHIYCLLNKRI